MITLVGAWITPELEALIPLRNVMLESSLEGVTAEITELVDRIHFRH